MITGRGDEGPWICKVSGPLQAALATASDSAPARAAVDWAQAEELQVNGISPDLPRVLEDLAGLARRAAARDEYLYCWVSL